MGAGESRSLLPPLAPALSSLLRQGPGPPSPLTVPGQDGGSCLTPGGRLGLSAFVNQTRLLQPTLEL